MATLEKKGIQESIVSEKLLCKFLSKVSTWQKVSTAKLVDNKTE